MLSSEPLLSSSSNIKDHWSSVSSVHFISVQLLSGVQLFVTPWIAAHQASLSITNSRSLSKLMSVESVMPSNHLILFIIISSSPLIILSPSPPAFNLSQHQRLFKWIGSLKQVASASASVLPMTIQDWFPLGWTGWSPCSPRDSQESSPTPQFKSIKSLALSFLCSPTLTFIHDYWKNHSLD